MKTYLTSGFAAALIASATFAGGAMAQSTQYQPYAESPPNLDDTSVDRNTTGSIYPMDSAELTPLFGQPDWFLGLLPTQSGNLRVLDTARWVLAERYRDDLREGLQYAISVQGFEWGLAVHQVSRSIRLDPQAVKWRSRRSQRPWLAGTVIEHMCALLDVTALAELIVAGDANRQAPGSS